MRNKSKKYVKTLAEVVLPFKVTFPVTVEGSINGKPYKYWAGAKSLIKTFSVYQAIQHSSYGKYFKSL